MTRQQAQELSIKSALMFSRIQRLDGCIYLEDPEQRDKHMHNFLLLDQPVHPNVLQSYRQTMAPYGWSQFRVEQPGEWDDLHTYVNTTPHVTQTLLYMAVPLTSITLPPSNKQLDMRRVDSHQNDAFFDFMYTEDLAYGEAYARGNRHRMKTVMQAHPDIVYYAVYVHSVIIGHIGIISHGHTVELDEFYIREAYQRQGFGTAMMHHIVNLIKKTNIRTLFLEANEEDTAQHMYRRWGFKDVGSYRFIRFQT